MFAFLSLFGASRSVTRFFGWIHGIAAIVFPFFSLFGASRFLARVFLHVAKMGCFYSSTIGLALFGSLIYSCCLFGCFAALTVLSATIKGCGANS